MTRTLVPLAILAAAAWTLGAAALASFGWRELRPHERSALELTAGFGIVAMLLSAALLLHLFSQATWILLAAALSGAAVKRARARRAREGSPNLAARIERPVERRSTRTAAAAILVCAAVACVGAIAPITDHDALSYVVPIARHIASEGALRVWTDQAPSTWPQGHTVLLAYIVHFGGDRLAALSALEWVVAVGAIAALARRVCERTEHAPLAVALAVAAPAAAFQVAAGKEDMLLLAATAAALFCAAGPLSIGEAAAAGVFAGVAAGAKYPGIGVALAVVIWIAVAAPRTRLLATMSAIGCAALLGGLWYALNVFRFGNPVAPFIAGVPGTPLDAVAVANAMAGYGGGLGVANLFITPLRLFLDAGRYGGRAQLFHPFVYAGIVGCAAMGLRARSAPLLVTAGLLYVGWYFTLQNARLLLPAAMLLAPAAADTLWSAMNRARWISFVVAIAVGVPLALAPVVGVLRASRYLSDPTTYMLRESEHYSGIEWANAHLDPSRHRVLSMFGVVGDFTVPAIGLDPLHQLEFGASDIADHDRLLAACRRQGVTHIFTARDELADVESQLRLVFEDRRSRVGDAHFFRAAPVEATALFEILGTD